MSAITNKNMLSLSFPLAKRSKNISAFIANSGPMASAYLLIPSAPLSNNGISLGPDLCPKIVIISEVFWAFFSNPLITSDISSNTSSVDLNLPLVSIISIPHFLKTSAAAEDLNVKVS